MTKTRNERIRDALNKRLVEIGHPELTTEQPKKRGKKKVLKNEIKLR